MANGGRRSGRIEVHFDRSVPTADRYEALARLGNSVVSAQDARGVYEVEVPDGTQWEWANRYMAVPGVILTEYTRPRIIADN